MEMLFGKLYVIVSTQNINLKKFFVDKIQEIAAPAIANNCHKIKDKIVNRYVVLRLKIASRRYNDRNAKFASKSLR